PSARKQVNRGSNLAAGQMLLVPVQHSSTSQTPAEARQTAPAFPAGCWQKSLVPLQVSVVHGLPSSVHSDPLAFFASGPHAWPGNPPQPSAMSHSPAAGRQMTPTGRNTSGGHVELTPV